GGGAGRRGREVVRDPDRPDHVVVPVHGVDTVEERDAQARLQRLRLAAVVHGAPVLQAVRARLGIAAVQDRPQEVRGDVRGLDERVLVGLRHLACLLLERHRAEERLRAGVEVAKRLAGGRGRRRRGEEGCRQDSRDECAEGGLHGRQHYALLSAITTGPTAQDQVAGGTGSGARRFKCWLRSLAPGRSCLLAIRIWHRFTRPRRHLREEVLTVAKRAFYSRCVRYCGSSPTRDEAACGSRVIREIRYKLAALGTLSGGQPFNLFGFA